MNADGTNQVRILADVILFPLCCDTQFENPAWQPVVQTPNTFNISGGVTYNDLPLSGVTINLSGTVNASVTANAAGTYQFSDLPAGGTYTVSPSYPRHYFTPPNRTFNDLRSNQTANFEVLAICRNGKCVKNGKIAFTANNSILTVNPDGTGQTSITSTAGGNTEPNWSPDGSTMIFTTNRDGNNEIYRMNGDGSSPLNLSKNSASDGAPYHSPDAASIVFVSNRDGNSEIFKMNADGSDQVRLTNTATVTEVDPAFSPDGQKVIFASRETQSAMKLWTMNADGTDQQQIPGSDLPGAYYSRPSYSPDGAKIIFVYGTDVTNWRIWTMNADGTNREAFPHGHISPSYSPDGQRVAVICCPLDPVLRERVRIVNADGSSMQVIQSSPNNSNFPHWQAIAIPRPAAFDFDGDGRSDISVFRPSDGFWYQLGSTAGFTAQQWGLSNDVLTPADYDGDMKTDLAVWRESDGKFYIMHSFDNTFRIEEFGEPGDIPTGGDWDGDGKADLAVYRDGAQGVFHYRSSMGNPQGNITSIDWGTTGDKPVAGDFDGDGRTDTAVFRPSSGIWYVRQSSTGELSGTNFGLAGDVLVPADYDGDGKTDTAVYRGGIWYLLRSSQGFTAFQFGVANDIPAPGDYDGDGRADITIYRNGIWWILRSRSGAAEAFGFGLGGDQPVPSAFVR